MEPLRPGPGEVFVKVGYAQFIPHTNIVAVVAGDGGRMPKTWVESFCDAIAPLGVLGSRWGTAALVQPGERDRLSASAGATSGKFKVDVKAQGLLEAPAQEPSGGLDVALQTLANAVRADLDISIDIKLKGKHSRIAGARPLLDLIGGSRFLRTSASRAQATAITESGVKEVLELVEHEMTAQILIAADTDDTRPNDFLQRELNRVCVERRDQLQSIYRQLA